VDITKLSLSQIKEVTSGAERIFEKDGRISFSRFTEAEEAVYLSDEAKRLRAISTPGIRLWFKTDATELNLGISVREKARPYFSVEVFSDDKFIGEIKNYPDNLPNGKYPGEEFPEGDYEKSFSLGKGEKCIKIILPGTVKAELSFLELSDVHKLIEDSVSSLSGIEIIDGWELVPHDKNLFGDENIHPNSLGFDEYYKNLIKKL